MTLKLSKLRSGTRSLILITRERVLRADFAAGGAQIKGLWQRVRPDSDDPAALVESAIGLGRKRLGRVIVLSSDVWTQTLRMPAEATRGLADEELSRALGFEAEPLSGIAAFESQVAYTALRSDAQHRDFWLAQTSSSQLTQIDDVVYRSGGVLAGFGHPAGVAHPAGAEHAGRPWQRVELWPGAIVCLRGGDGQSPQVHVVNADPAQRAWQANVDQWLGADAGSASVEWLIPDAGVQSPGSSGATINLSQDEALRLWLAAAAQRLFGSAGGVPLVRPAPRPMSKEKRRAITAVLTAVALSACGGHYFWNERTIADLNAQSQAIRAEVTNLTALKKQITDASAKRDKAQAEMDKLGQKVTLCDETLAAYQLRWKKLLELLAQQRPEHLVVQKIDSVGEKLSITGLCLGPHPANALASGLGLRLRELGWEVQPASQQAGTALVSGEPWRFELVLRDFDASDAASPLNPAAPTAPLQPLPRQPVNKVASLRGPSPSNQPVGNQQ